MGGTFIWNRPLEGSGGSKKNESIIVDTYSDFVDISQEIVEI